MPNLFGGQQSGPQQRYADRYANFAQQSPFGGFSPGLLGYAQLGSQLLGNNNFQPFLPPPVPEPEPPPVAPAAPTSQPRNLGGYTDTPWGPRRTYHKSGLLNMRTDRMRFGGR